MAVFCLVSPQKKTGHREPTDHRMRLFCLSSGLTNGPTVRKVQFKDHIRVEMLVDQSRAAARMWRLVNTTD
jgi:hypothetical protein